MYFFLGKKSLSGKVHTAVRRKYKPKMRKSKLSRCQWVNFIDSECEICTRLYPEKSALAAYGNLRKVALINASFSPQGIISPKEDSNAKYHCSKSSISTLESTTFFQPFFLVPSRLKSCGCVCVPVVVCLSSPVLRLDGAELSSPKLNYTHLTHTSSTSKQL